LKAKPFEKPVVVVSRCLEFSACRYDGKKIADAWVRRMKPFVRFLPVCPEVEIGLGTPRDPVRIVSTGVRRLVQPSTGADLSVKMRRVAAARLDSLEEADGFLLKSRSPSCGLTGVKLYANADAALPSGRGTGFFAEAVLARFPHLAVEDEARLQDETARRHFFTKLFALAAFRKIKKSPSMKALVSFHAARKSVFTNYGPAEFHALDRLMTLPPEKTAGTFREYEKRLFTLFARPARFKKRWNTPGFRPYPAKLEKA
jgi:uncharacterized protein YbbK (DUF523 family)